MCFDWNIFLSLIRKIVYCNFERFLKTEINILCQDFSITLEFKEIIKRNVNNISDYSEIFLFLNKKCYFLIVSP